MSNQIALWGTFEGVCEQLEKFFTCVSYYLCSQVKWSTSDTWGTKLG